MSEHEGKVNKPYHKPTKKTPSGAMQKVCIYHTFFLHHVTVFFEGPGGCFGGAPGSSCTPRCNSKYILYFLIFKPTLWNEKHEWRSTTFLAQCLPGLFVRALTVPACAGGRRLRLGGQRCGAGTRAPCSAHPLPSCAESSRPHVPSAAHSCPRAGTACPGPSSPAAPGCSTMTHPPRQQMSMIHPVGRYL